MNNCNNERVPANFRFAKYPDLLRSKVNKSFTQYFISSCSFFPFYQRTMYQPLRLPLSPVKMKNIQWEIISAVANKQYSVGNVSKCVQCGHKETDGCGLCKSSTPCQISVFR